jgi:hypothetical protein
MRIVRERGMNSGVNGVGGRGEVVSIALPRVRQKVCCCFLVIVGTVFNDPLSLVLTHVTRVDKR